MFKRRISDATGEPETYIAPTANLTGEIDGAGSFIVCGKMNGNCDISGSVTLAREGTWRGTIKADNIVVAGTVEGDVLARERIEVHSTARIHGGIEGHSIAIEEGAVIEGQLNVTSGGQATRFVDRRRVEEGADDPWSAGEVEKTS